MRLKLTLQYDGGPYVGWQRQVEHGVERPSVQGELIAAWTRLTGETAPDFQAAGRTDAGVHALGQVAHVDTGWPQAATPIKVMDGLNHHLPDSIRVARVSQVDDDFHARFWGVSRRYRYVLFNSRMMRPDWRGRAGLERRPLDVGAMRAALEAVSLGEHDFSGFRDAECQSKTPLCTLLERRVEDAGEGFIHFHFAANHFLHHMVRNLVGTLVAVGRGERPADELARIIKSRDRREAGRTFGPEGLYFLGVEHRPHAERNVVPAA
jgi:tRNA pseudouridine38-40 synthase